MTLDIQVLAWNRLKHVAGLNSLIEIPTLPYISDGLNFIMSKCIFNQLPNHTTSSSKEILKKCF
jgi:hypothetical protein